MVAPSFFGMLARCVTIMLLSFLSAHQAMTRSISAACDRYYERLRTMTEQRVAAMSPEDKGDLAYIALQAVEKHLATTGKKLSDDTLDKVHEALWETLRNAVILHA